jgi:hypothetical protein
LHQTKLLSWQRASQYLTINQANGRFKLYVLCMNMRQIMVLVVEQVPPNNDSLEHAAMGTS